MILGIITMENAFAKEETIDTILDGAINEGDVLMIEDIKGTYTVVLKFAKRYGIETRIVFRKTIETNDDLVQLDAKDDYTNLNHLVEFSDKTLVIWDGTDKRMQNKIKNIKNRDKVDFVEVKKKDPNSKPARIVEE